MDYAQIIAEHVPLLVMIYGLVEVVKRYHGNSRDYPLISVVFGVAVAFAFYPQSSYMRTAELGIVSGLFTSGVYKVAVDAIRSMLNPPKTNAG